MEILSTILYIFIALLVFCVIIIVHELGHFIAAKLCDVKVNEFAIGMGPVIFQKQTKETKYALRVLPIGGFVAMEGEDGSSEDPRAFHHKPVWQRMIIILAGAFMNLVLGLILFVIITSTQTMSSTIISNFTENSLSSRQLQIGDKILKVNGMSIYTSGDIVYKMQNSAAQREDGSFAFDFVVERNGETLELKEVVFAENIQVKKGNIYFDFKVKPLEHNFVNVVSQSFANTASTARLIWISLVDLITGNYGINDLSGPVSVVNVIKDTAQRNLPDVLSIAAFITINVGIINLLPFPALDGARFVFLVIELIRRKPMKPEHEGIVHFVGLVLLFGLMILVTFQDIGKLIFGA